MNQVLFFVFVFFLKVWWLNQFGKCWINFLIEGLLESSVCCCCASLAIPIGSRLFIPFFVVVVFWWWFLFLFCFVLVVEHLPEATGSTGDHPLRSDEPDPTQASSGVLTPEGALPSSLPQGSWQEANRMVRLSTAGKPMRALFHPLARGLFYEGFWGKFIQGKGPLLPSWVNGLFVSFMSSSLLWLLGTQKTTVTHLKRILFVIWTLVNSPSSWLWLIISLTYSFWLVS